MTPLRACTHFLVVLAVGTAFPATPADAQDALPTIELRPGLVITRSVRIEPRVYAFAARASPDSALITIRGDDITVDFAGAVLQGLTTGADPDGARGTAIRIEGGARVQLRNARVHGYKVAVLAWGTRGLALTDNDFSHNWKPRLFSGVEQESLADWLSFHRNEDDEWLRFGAGIYLVDVRGGEIRGNRIEQGMNGLMLVRSDSITIRNNTIEFNSGVGIGLYRASDNVIVHNHTSYNIRGYSHGRYRRGQDSADLLMYEQSSRNVVAFNSMTHGGDGLFLWAGQSTMDSGRGGSNDNIFFANDFSYAATNAMEATFSRNTFIGNRAIGSEYGLWGGYSYDSRVLGNDFRWNRTGVAIEHGQDNVIGANRFLGDSVAIRLWANPAQPPDWGYPRQRDTRSRDNRIDNNNFFGNRVGIRATASQGLAIARNQFIAVDTAWVLRDVTGAEFLVNDTTDVRERGLDWPPLPAHRTLEPALILPRPLPDGLPLRDTLTQRDRSSIIIDEWGPYDFRSPKLWPVARTDSVPLPLVVHGPPGAWRVVERRGVQTLSREEGRTGDTLMVTPARGAGVDWEVALEYRGAATVSPRGERRAAGEPYRFGYSRFEPVAGWEVRFHAWDDASDPRAGAEAFGALLRGTPLHTRTEPRLNYVFHSPPFPAVPQSRFATVATTTVTLPPGEYTLRAISDDGIRVWVDDRLVIDHWTPHASAVDVAPVSAGRHTLRVEHYQLDGWTELRVEVLRGTSN